jgi:hypothetical protein
MSSAEDQLEECLDSRDTIAWWAFAVLFALSVGLACCKLRGDELKRRLARALSRDPLQDELPPPSYQESLLHVRLEAGGETVAVGISTA